MDSNAKREGRRWMDKEADISVCTAHQWQSRTPSVDLINGGASPLMIISISVPPCYSDNRNSENNLFAISTILFVHSLPSIPQIVDASNRRERKLELISSRCYSFLLVIVNSLFLTAPNWCFPVDKIRRWRWLFLRRVDLVKSINKT